MAEQKIELRKIRDFSENLSDTFLFIRQNFKPLIKIFFAICGIFMLAHAIFNGLFESRAFGVFDEFRRGLTSRRASSFETVFTPEYFLALLLSWISFVAIRVTIGAYIKFYLENNGEHPAIYDIWKYFTRYFFRVLFYTIPVAIVIGIGFICCIIPGIYLIVVLVPFDFVLIIEDAGFTDAFNRCFNLIKNNFWISLGIYIVAGLIYWFGTMIIGMIIGVIIGLSAFFTTDNIGATAGMVTSFLNIFSSTFYIIFLVSAALQYFNLVESHDGTGLLQRVESMGEDKNNFDNTQEQY
ncbi:MAG: hypothetical protein JST87_12120 [Bacteroidetes bacterium]|nr:hypothetical protein [Bacteroidota bacterium]